MKRIIFVISFIMLLGACAYPKTVTESKEERPMIAIIGAEPEHMLFVDGLSMGPAQRYSDDHALLLEPGHHVMEIRKHGNVLFTEQFSLGRNQIRTFTIVDSD